MSAWNFFVMLLLVLFGQSIIELDYDPHVPVSQSTQKQKHFTVIFNLFIFLQLFNLVNCRKLARDLNVFEKFFHNFNYLLVIVIIVGFQACFIQLMPFISQCQPLNRNEWGSCIFVGASALLISAIAKLLPDSLMQRVPVGRLIDEDSVIDNKVLSTWKGGFANSSSDNYHFETENEKLDHSDDKFESAP